MDVADIKKGSTYYFTRSNQRVDGLQIFAFVTAINVEANRVRYLNNGIEMTGRLTEFAENHCVPVLPEPLTRLGAELRMTDPAEVNDEDGALPWAVWDPKYDSILGSGSTPEEAIAAAVETVSDWNL